MPDKKLTDNEVVKAKELIKMLREAYNAYYDTSKGMPYNIDETLRESAFCLENCLNEINRLQAENENYSKNNRQMTSDILKLYKELEQAEAENERLKEEIELLHSDYTYKLVKKKAKAEAYKEFAERLKETAYHNDAGDYIIFDVDIDNLLKELVGEDNG